MSQLIHQCWEHFRSTLRLSSAGDELRIDHNALSTVVCLVDPDQPIRQLKHVVPQTYNDELCILGAILYRYQSLIVTNVLELNRSKSKSKKRLIHHCGCVPVHCATNYKRARSLRISGAPIIGSYGWFKVSITLWWILLILNFLNFS